MSNYPPGVTGNEPEIAGERHYAQCPRSEDFSEKHVCPEMRGYGYVVEAHGKWWQLVIWHNGGLAAAIGIAFCPYCADELPYLGHCCCAEIRAAMAEDEALTKGGL